MTLEQAIEISRERLKRHEEEKRLRQLAVNK